MHLPDGVLPTRVWAPFAIASGVSLTLAARRLRGSQASARIALTGFMAAAVIVLQTVNFPLIAGTSAHFLGTATLVCMLGLELALIAMSAVLLIQSLVMQDGGVLALGSNFVDLALVPALLAHALVSRRFANESPRALATRTAVAAWLGTACGAVVTALQLSGAHALPLRLGMSWLLGSQLIVGVMEAALTFVLIHTLARRRSILLRPHVLHDNETNEQTAVRWHWLVLGLVLIAVIAIPLASQRPDVLEHLLKQRATTGQFVPSLHTASHS